MIQSEVNTLSNLPSMIACKQFVVKRFLSILSTFQRNLSAPHLYMATTSVLCTCGRIVTQAKSVMSQGTQAGEIISK